MVAQVKLTKDEAIFFDTNQNIMCKLEIGHVVSPDGKRTFDVNAIFCCTTYFDENGKETDFKMEMIDWFFGETDDLREVVKYLRSNSVTNPIVF